MFRYWEYGTILHKHLSYKYNPNQNPGIRMFLKAQDKAHVKAYFAERMQRPVRLIVFGQRGTNIEDPLPIQHELCSDAEQLLAEVAEASSLISIERHDLWQDRPAMLRYNVDKVPAIALLGEEEDYGIRFYGVPANYEFVTFMETIAAVSSGEPDLNEQTIAALQGIEKDIHIQVFYTPTCAFCPIMTHLGHQFAIASPRVRCDSIDAAEFPQLAKHYRVKGSPHVVINETAHSLGMKSEAEFLQAVLRAARQPCPVLV